MDHIGYQVVTDDSEAIEVCEYLASFDLLAIDTETYSNGKDGPTAYYDSRLVDRQLWISDPYLNHVRLVQLRSRESDSFLFDIRALGPAGQAALSTLLNKPHITFVGHNLKFDWKMLAVNLNARMPNVFCTMIAAICLGYATGDGAMWSRGVGLKDVVRDFLDKQIAKTEQKSNWGAKQLTPEQEQYAADDLLYLFDLYDLFVRVIDEEFSMLGAVQLEMAVLPEVCEMELNGINFDIELFKRVQKAAETALPVLEEEICNFIEWPMMQTPPLVRLKTGRAYQPKPSKFEGESKSPLDSNPFMLKAFHTKGIVIDNLQGDTLQSMKEFHPILEVFSNYKDLVKMLSFPYDTWMHPVTGRIHPEFNQSGAATGRFSCNNPNLQQVPKMELQVPERLVDDYLSTWLDAGGKPACWNTKKNKWIVNYRMCFTAPAGELVYGADFSGQEVRIMAVLSGDSNLIKIHDENQTPALVPDPDGKTTPEGNPVLVKNMAADVHAATCELIFANKGITCWNAKSVEFPGMPGKTYRDVIKPVVYGVAYGKSPNSLAKDMGRDEKEVKKEIYDPFFKPYRKLKRWLDEVGEFSNETRLSMIGIPETGIVRWRMVNSTRHEDKGALSRAGKNSPIQGCGALMMKKSLVMLGPRVRAAGGQLIATVHDEVLVRGPANKRDEIKAAINAGMKLGSNFFFRDIVTDCWGIGIDRFWCEH